MEAVAFDGGDERRGERGDDGGADAVQAAGMVVVLVLEFSAGVQRR